MIWIVLLAGIHESLCLCSRIELLIPWISHANDLSLGRWPICVYARNLAVLYSVEFLLARLPRRSLCKLLAIDEGLRLKK